MLIFIIIIYEKRKKQKDKITILLCWILVNNKFIVTSKVLKFRSYVTTCIKTNYKISQPFARGGTSWKFQKDVYKLSFCEDNSRSSENL